MFDGHQYSEYANRTLPWLGLDNQHTYAKNFTTRYNQLKEYGWLNKKIDYKFNSYGFRSDEFSSDPSMVSLGCSHTCGIGIPIENSWTSIVSKSLSLKNFNLGVGGSSNDTAFRLAYHWLHQLKPKIVVHMATERHRFELHVQNKIQNYGPWSNAADWAEWASNQTNIDMNFLKNKLAIECICKNLNIKLVQIEYLTLEPEIRVQDLARDLAHGGIKSNQKMAEHVLSNI